MRHRKFDAQRALRSLRQICRVSHFMPAGINPYELRGAELERYLAVSRARADVVTGLFRRLGYTVSRTPVNYQGRKGVNLFAYQGRKNVPQRLLFIAHHDYCAGVGAEDNATALAVMLELARVFCGNTSIAFASFELEEPGLVGSHQFVEELAQQGRLNFDAVIDLECLGSGTDIVICAEVAQAKSDPQLVAKMQAAAADVGHNLPARSYDYFWADHVPFAKRGMKTVELGSINDSCRLNAHERQHEFLRAAQGKRRRDGSVAHTNFDVPESISAANLQKVGDLLTRFIESNDR
jgi:hypothetical protein